MLARPGHTGRRAGVRAGRTRGAGRLYIHDPDGNEIELYIDVPGVDWVNDPELIMAPIKPLRL